MTTHEQHDSLGTPRDRVFTMSVDDYLALKHSTGYSSPALGALLRDRYGDDCSALTCDNSAEVVFIMLNQPTIAIPLCENHALQTHQTYADLAEHLPKLTPETQALFPGSNDVGSLSALLTTRPDESELRDDDEPEGTSRSADER